MEPLKMAKAAPDFAVREDWEVVRLWRVATIRSERNRPDLQLLSVFLGQGVIRYEEGGGQVHKPGHDLAAYQVVHPGDLVLNNQQAWRGSVGVSKYHGIISPAYIVLALSPELNAGYADYLFQSVVMVDQFVTASKGVGDIQREVHIPWLKNCRLPVPPAEDQAAAARLLEWMNNRIARYSHAAQRLIAANDRKRAAAGAVITRGLLAQYRKRSIADVVTGKLDVRKAAARLPEGAEGVEPLVEAKVEGEAQGTDAGDGDGLPEETEA